MRMLKKKKNVLLFITVNGIESGNFKKSDFYIKVARMT